MDLLNSTNNFLLEESPQQHLLVLRFLTDLSLEQQQALDKPHFSYQDAIINQTLQILLKNNRFYSIVNENSKLAGVVSQFKDYQIVYLLGTKDFQDLACTLDFEPYFFEGQSDFIFHKGYYLRAFYLYEKYFSSNETPLYFVSHDIGASIAYILQSILQIHNDNNQLSLAPLPMIYKTPNKSANQLGFVQKDLEDLEISNKAVINFSDSLLANSLISAATIDSNTNKNDSNDEKHNIEQDPKDFHFEQIYQIFQKLYPRILKSDKGQNQIYRLTNLNQIKEFTKENDCEITTSQKETKDVIEAKDLIKSIFLQSKQKLSSIQIGNGEFKRSISMQPNQINTKQKPCPLKDQTISKTTTDLIPLRSNLKLTFNINFQIDSKYLFQSLSLQFQEISTIQQALENIQNIQINTLSKKLEIFSLLVYHQASSKFKLKNDESFIKQINLVYNQQTQERQYQAYEIQQIQHRHNNTLFENGIKNLHQSIQNNIAKPVHKKTSFFDTILRVFSNERKTQSDQVTKNKEYQFQHVQQLINPQSIQDFFDNSIIDIWNFINQKTDYGQAVLLLFIKNCLKINKSKILALKRQDAAGEEEKEKDKSDQFAELSSIPFYQTYQAQIKQKLSENDIQLLQINSFINSSIPLSYLLLFATEQAIGSLALHSNILNLYQFITQQSQKSTLITEESLKTQIRRWNGILYFYSEDVMLQKDLNIKQLQSLILTQLCKITKKNAQYWSQELKTLNDKPSPFQINSFVFWRYQSLIGFQPDFLNHQPQQQQAKQQEGNQFCFIKQQQLSKCISFLEQMDLIIQTELKTKMGN